MREGGRADGSAGAGVAPVGLTARLTGVLGGRTATALEQELGITTVGGLLEHLPRRYLRRGELTDLGALQPGEHVTVQAEVVSVQSRRLRKTLHKTDVTVTDGRHRLVLTFFNQAFRAHTLRPQTSHFFAGKVGEFRGKPQLTNPEVLEDLFGLDAPGVLVAVYPTTAGLTTPVITRSVSIVLAGFDVADRDDPLPVEMRERLGLPGLAEAYTLVHRPAQHADHERGRRRLAFDEALLVQVALAQRRRLAERVPAVPRPPRPDGLLAAFDARLPFTLTQGQRELGALLADELAGRHPLHRLLQGEVGTGKTLVALRAMLQVVDAGGQAAFMAPTEVLAGQHVRALRGLLGPLAAGGELGAADGATRIALLTGSQTASQRRAALDEAASGAAGIVVGTHALLELTVQWHDLGMIVVDEQHRFGVQQRDALRANGVATGATPHLLVMTATPIPRTVAMTVFGDLEVSALTELPLGRQPISTSVVPPEQPAWLAAVWRRVRTEVGSGHQAFVVCPRIAPGDLAEGTGGAAVEEVLALLAEGELAGLRLAALHGQLGGEDKDAVMTGFARGDIDVLVATTVIEVGVDVGNATVMVVLDADRFGVSQLHQLRGRVGRGTAASVCLLQTSAPGGTPGRARVEAVAATGDGAELALLDLAQRREGDVLGAVQSGRHRTLRRLDLLSDVDLIGQARAEATAVVDLDPDLEVHRALARALAELLAEEAAAYLEKG